MKRIKQKCLSQFTLVTVTAIAFVSCDRANFSSNTPKMVSPSVTNNSELKVADVLPHRTFLISANGMGPIKLGMSIDEAKKAFPDAKFERTSDGDGAALIDVLLGKDSVMSLYADEDDPGKPINWSKKISVIESFSPTCVNDVGIRVGTLVLDAEKVYGKTKSIIKSEIESREYIEFQKHPKHLTFRIDYTGIYPDDSRETTQFNPQAKIYSIAISSH